MAFNPEYLGYFVYITREEIESCDYILDYYNVNKDDYDAQQLFDYKDNKESIFSVYNDEQKHQHNNQADKNFIVKGTRIKISQGVANSLIHVEDETIKYAISLQFFNKERKVFWDDKTRKRYEDKLTVGKNFYRKVEQIAYVKVLLREFDFTKVKDNQVRDFSTFYDSSKVVDITEYVVSCRTGETDFGSVFDLELAPIQAELFTDNSGGKEWRMVGGYSLQSGTGKRTDVKTIIQNFNLKNRNYYFEKILNFNYIVFIKFDEDFLYRTKGDGKPKIGFGGEEDYNLIGLIDGVGVNETVDNNLNINVAVSGRDLSKMLIEDKVLFFPASRTTVQSIVGTGETDEEKRKITMDNYSQLIANIQYKGEADTKFKIHKKFVERIFGKLYDDTLLFKRTVNDLLRLILQRLSIMDFYIPDDCLHLDNQSISSFTKFKFVDNGAGGLLIEENSTASVIARKNSIWNLIDLFTDESELQANRTLYDSTITEASGSILSFLQKIAQSPFVELFGITSGEKWNLIARTPPLTMDMYLGTDKPNSGNLTIEVGDEDIISENTKTDDKEAFSWFRLEPLGIFFGDKTARLLDFPAILCDEFINIFGSKLQDLTSNYLGGDNSIKVPKDKDGNSLLYTNTYHQAFLDMCFFLKGMIISPFMKKGTITIYGNRLVHRGMNLYLKDRDMMYYIKQVEQSSNLADRKTVCTVDRGMKKSNRDLFENVINIPSITEEQKQTLNKIKDGETEKLKQLEKETLSNITVDLIRLKKLLAKIDLEK